MATKKKISAEEAAVRAALAVVQADTGLAKAQEIIKTGAVPAETATAKPTYEGMRSQLSEIKDPKVREALEKSFASTDKLTETVTKQYEALGYTYDPNTNTATPKVNTGGSDTNLNKDNVVNKDAVIDKDTQDAYAILKSALSKYGLESLYTVIEGYMKSGLGPEQAKLKIKQEPAYQARFAGNEKRRTAGLNVLSEAEYLGLEDAYSQTLKAYGQQSYFGATRDARQTTMAALIGGDVSATEFKDRIDLAVTRVTNADPAIKTQLKAFYNIEDADLVGYFLNPTQNLPKLEEKVKAAEIGSAAAAQNLVTSMTTAEDLAKFGIDLATARKGYATIADVLPTAGKLSDIYKEEGITYNQATAEAETFKGLASAQRKRLKLAEKEIASFSGQSGMSKYSLGSKSAGQI